ncbi:hypothetical protein [Streptomyces sp. BBFR109]|uniref:hypothetical protein n=1 Tax=Streptomyces sp. BBFR109 TaxID=3448172 RepID=UPI003F764654
MRTEAAEAMPGDRAALMDGTDARGRAGDPGEIAGVVSFLAGPAGSYVNGAVFFADGRSSEAAVRPGVLAVGAGRGPPWAGR